MECLIYKVESSVGQLTGISPRHWKLCSISLFFSFTNVLFVRRAWLFVCLLVDDFAFGQENSTYINVRSRHSSNTLL